jgi:type I restriction enzyme S subunit
MKNVSTMYLGDIATIATGKIDVNKAVANGNYPFFTCAKEIYKINDAPFEGKAILVAGNGDLNVKYYEGKFNAYQRTYFLFSKNEQKYYPKYIYWYLEHYVQTLRNQSIGTTIKYIKLGNLTEAPIPIPSLKEQEELVSILEDHLSRLDAALADVKQAKLKGAQFRRSLLNACFTGLLFEGEKDAETGIPCHWVLTTLSEVAKWTSGGTPTSSNSSYYDGDTPWVVIGDLTEGVVMDTAKMITATGLEASSAKILPQGTVMLAMYGASIGRTGVMGKSMSTNQAIACGIVDESKIVREFLFYFLQSQKQNFIFAGKGGAQPNISQGVVKEWAIALPPLNEQREIIFEIERQLSKLESSVKLIGFVEKEAAALRRSLLQAAFTGQLTKEEVNV